MTQARARVLAQIERAGKLRGGHANGEIKHQARRLDIIAASTELKAVGVYESGFIVCLLKIVFRKMMFLFMMRRA